MHSQQAEAGHKLLADRMEERRRNGPSLRILFIEGKDPGVTRHIDALRRALILQGHQLFAASPRRHPALVADEEFNGAHRRVVSLKCISKALQEFDPDVVVVPLSSHAIDEWSRKWCDARGTLLLNIDPLGSNLGEDARYHIRSGPSRDSGGWPFVPGVDASMLSHGPGPKRASLFSVVDDELLLRNSPDLHQELAAASDTYFQPADPASVLKAAACAAAVRVYPPQMRQKRTVSWAMLEALSSGVLVLLPDDLSGRYAHLPGVLGYAGAPALAQWITRIRTGDFDVAAAAAASVQAMGAKFLYEDQFDRLFDLAVKRVGSPSSGFPAAVGARISSRWLEGPTADAPVVGISGWYGERNVGDELILTSLVQGIRRVSPSAQVVVAAPKPSHVEEDHGLAAYPRHEAKAMAQMAEYAHCLIVGGGGIWNDKAAARNGGIAGLFAAPRYSVVNLATLPVMLTALGKPVAGIGLGVGPLDDPSGRAVVRLMASLCTSVGVRDEASRQLLESLGGSLPAVGVESDLAFALELEARPVRCAPRTAGRWRLAVNIRPADSASGPASDDLWPGLAASLTRLAADGDCEIVGVPFHQDDEAELGRLFEASSLPVSGILPFVADAAQLAADLASADVAVSMRLHASILSHRMRVPAIGLDYEQKVAGYFSEMAEDERVVGTSDKPEALYALIRTTLENRPSLSKTLEAKADELEREATRALDARLRGLLAEVKSTPFDFLPVPPQ